MDPPRVIVIGARTARQGIGEYVAAWFARHGARVVAVVGTTPETVAQARAALRERYAIDARGYTTVEAALAGERLDLAAICSPYLFHREHLAAVGRAGLHCLCEKPLFWPGSAGSAPDPVAQFVEAGRHLDLLTQWPYTLPAFFALHAEQARAAVERFDMWLSPVSSGLDMVPDAVPHFVGMLRALGGAGVVHDVAACFVDGDPRRLHIECVHEHPGGRTEAVLRLQTCPQRPRPAGYAINGARVDREIRLAGYQQFFRAGDRRVTLEDPLGCLTARFLSRVADGTPTDRAALDHDQQLLTVLGGVVRAAASLCR